MLEASLAEDGYPQVSLGAEVSRVKAERRDRAARAARTTSQGFISQLLRRGRTVEEATETELQGQERELV